MLDGIELRTARVGGNEGGDWMLANDVAFRRAPERAELLFHCRNAARAFLQKHARLSNTPADINGSQEREAVRSEVFADLVLELGALNALVEFVDALDGWRQFAIQTRLIQRARGLAESGDDGHFGRPHLER